MIFFIQLVFENMMSVHTNTRGPTFPNTFLNVLCFVHRKHV